MIRLLCLGGVFWHWAAYDGACITCLGACCPMFGRRRPLHIGLSARIFHPESGGVGLKAKTLQVLEQ